MDQVRHQSVSDFISWSEGPHRDSAIIQVPREKAVKASQELKLDPSLERQAGQEEGTNMVALGTQQQVSQRGVLSVGGGGWEEGRRALQGERDSLWHAQKWRGPPKYPVCLQHQGTHGEVCSCWDVRGPFMEGCVSPWKEFGLYS